MTTAGPGTEPETEPQTAPGTGPGTPPAAREATRTTSPETTIEAAPADDEAAFDLVERFGSPLFVYDFDAIEARVRALQAVLPPVVDLAFALKANPALAVVHWLGRLGLGADVASAGELATALLAGIEPDRIVLTGPGTRDDELRAAVSVGIRAITVESPGELDRLERIVAVAGRSGPVPILLRASTAAAPWQRDDGGGLAIDDGSGKFGMDAADLRTCARRASASSRLDLLGLHAFGWSNVLDADVLADHVETTVEAAIELARMVGTPLRLVDAGGGLGIPYGPGEPTLDLVRFGDRLDRIVRSWTDDPLTRRARLLLEPGRFLVGPAGRYLARVVDTKTLAGRPTIVLDGGIHHLLRPILVGRAHGLRLRRRRSVDDGRLDPRLDDRLDRRPTTVAGPLCTGLDVLGRDVLLPPAIPDDLLEVRDVGAYGFTESMPLFLSHPMPAEVALHDGRAELIRPRLEPQSWPEAQRVPAW